MAYNAPSETPQDDLGERLSQAAFDLLSFSAAVIAATREIADAAKNLTASLQGANHQQQGSLQQQKGLAKKGRKRSGGSQLRNNAVALGKGLIAAGKAFIGGASPLQTAKAGIHAAGQNLSGSGKALAELAEKAISAAQALNKLEGEQQRYMQSLARFSANMAQIEAERNIQEIFREREKGDRLSSSARSLVESEQRAKDQTKELDILWNNVKNNVGTAWNDFKTGFAREMNRVVKPLNEIMGNTDKNLDKFLTMGEWVQQIANEDRRWRDEQNRRNDWESPSDNGVVAPGGEGRGGDFR